MSVLSILDRVAPPPQLLLMPSVGVDISDTSLKYIQFNPSHGHSSYHTIRQWGEIEIPNGVLERGHVVDQGKLVAVLKSLRDQTQSQFVRVSLPEERAYLFETTIKKNTPKNELRSLLEFRLEENVPIAAKDTLFDFDVLHSQTSSSDVNVVVAAYARETIEVYYNACREAGITPLSFEVEAQAMARAVLPRDHTDTHLLVDFGKTRTGIGIVHAGKLVYTSTIDIGGGQLSQVLRRVLGDLPESELTTIKNTQGLVPNTNDSKCYDALISTVSVIKDEIATRLQYWHTNNPERRITSIILCGGSVNMKGLPEYFSDALGINAIRANVWQNALSLKSTVPPIDLRHSYGYATTIGLALKHTV